MSTLRTLIVDDEPAARQVLREELGGFDDVTVAGEAASGEEALAQIARLEPDLVLLDLQMPGLGGFDVIHRLPPGALPAIVIVTAYDRHAIRAFEAGALDYLLKPVGRDRLEKTLNRVRQLRRNPAGVAESIVRLSEIPAADGPPRGVRPGRKIAGKSGSTYHLLDLDDVLAFQAEGEIVWILTARQRFMATGTLRDIAARLAGSAFQRVHRNALVNAGHVRKMTPLTSRRWMLTLSDGRELIVSKRQAHNVRRMLQW
jgi:DNA-binding LytR/AlgR family response regulator